MDVHGDSSDHDSRLALKSLRGKWVKNGLLRPALKTVVSRSRVDPVNSTVQAEPDGEGSCGCGLLL